jgi:hypothetical protein
MKIFCRNCNGKGWVRHVNSKIIEPGVVVAEELWDSCTTCHMLGFEEIEFEEYIKLRMYGLKIIIGSWIRVNIIYKISNFIYKLKYFTYKIKHKKGEKK